MRLLSLLFGFSLACGGTGNTRGGMGNPPPPSKTGTRFRLGDYVVYRYTGTFSDSVTLREDVRAQEGNRLRIDVLATRGAQTRRWVQVLTDTQANQQSNTIDSLYEWRDGRYVLLQNVNNTDLLRLYDWTFVTPDGPPDSTRTDACEQRIVDTAYSCRCTTGNTRIGARAVTFESTQCAEFLWQHGRQIFRDQAADTDVLRMEVIEVGRDPAAVAASFDPLHP